MGKFREHYRPERHYMRGPGPKWHAKHAAALVSAASAQRELKANAQPACKAQHDLPLSIWIIPATAATLLGIMAVVALA